MDIITPAVGQLFWGAIVFLILLFLLGKYAWKPILNAVNQRENAIAESLEQAEKVNAEMKVLQAKNQDLLAEARAERDAMIRDAKATTNKMVEDAKTTAKEEGAKQLASARAAIESEKIAAIAEMKAQMANLSIEIAEKIIKGELATADKQKALAEKLVGDINLN